MAAITINKVSMDPERDGPQLAALNLASARARDSNYVLVQVAHPLSKQERATLSGMGVTLLEFVPENTYLGRFEGDDLGPIQALPFVAWANSYLKGFKIAPELTEHQMRRSPIELMAMVEDPAPLSDERRLVDIVLHEDMTADAVRQKVAAATGLDPTVLDVGHRKIRAKVPAARLRDLASLDEIRHIEQVKEPSFSNDVALRILRADSVHGHNPSFRGAGQIVAVADSGFDRGATSGPNVHPAFTGRVHKLYALGRAEANDPHGHGTHVAGSVLGDGNAQAHGAVAGTAPAARLVLQSVLDSSGGLGGLPTDLNHLFEDPYTVDGARVHTNSWGTRNSHGEYSQSSFEVDEAVWRHRDLVVCFAAGNDGSDGNSNGVIDLGSVEAPGTAKNCITVGASENDRVAQSQNWGVGSWRFRYPVGPITNDLWADNPDGMAAFSGRGPTADGRIKPDVVAPGTSILSACSRDSTASTFWGTSPDPLFCYSGGTSMATPLVAGCAAVVREYLSTTRNIANPTAALIKAMLINGAVDLAGQYAPSEAGPAPNFSEGFGRVDLERTLAVDDPDGLTMVDENVALDVGEEQVLQIDVPDGATGLKATLVWTDPPGATLQNDLDLIVRTSDGQERHGNMPPGGPGFDRANNVEQVDWPGAVSGPAQVIVRAHRISLHAQTFALVVRLGR